MSLNMSETFRSSTPYRAVAAVINAECSHLDDVIRGCGITDDFWTITSRPALAEFCEEQNFDRVMWDKLVETMMAAEVILDDTAEFEDNPMVSGLRFSLWKQMRVLERFRDRVRPVVVGNA